MKSINDLELEEQLERLRKRYKETKDPIVRQVILRQVRALKIAHGE